MTVFTETVVINESNPNVLSVRTYEVESNQKPVLLSIATLVDGIRSDYEYHSGFVTYHRNGSVHKDFSLIQGKLRKISEYSEESYLILEETFDDYVLHSYDMKPSRTVYRSDTTRYSDEWHRHGVYDGMGKVIYASDGRTRIGIFYYDNNDLISASSSYRGRNITAEKNIITIQY